MTSPNPYERPSSREFCGTPRGAGALPSDSVRWLQFELQRHGFYWGRIDGVFNRSTQKAVHQAQKAFHLRMDGLITRELLDRLEA